MLVAVSLAVGLALPGASLASGAGACPAAEVRQPLSAGTVPPDHAYVDVEVLNTQYALLVTGGQAEMLAYAIQLPDFTCVLVCAGVSDGLMRPAVCLLPPGFHEVVVRYVWSSSGSVDYVLLAGCGQYPPYTAC